MDVCFASNTPACRDISSVSGPSTDLSNSTYYSSRCLSMTDLKICLTEFVSVEDIEMPTSGFNLFAGDNNKCNAVRDYEHGDSDNRKTRNTAYEKCFSSTVTFLALAEPISFLDGLVGGEKERKSLKTSEVIESAESVNEGNLRSTSLPVESYIAESVKEGNLRSTSLPFDTILSGTPLKLVSALKGSRAKQIIAPKKLSVTWAADVYDPTPTSVSHALLSRNQHGNKYGKNKNKGGGKSSRGSKSKDKKQTRKSGGGVSKSKPLGTMATV